MRLDRCHIFRGGRGLLMAAMLALPAALPAATPEPATCEPRGIWLMGADGPVRISVELALTDAARARGLMERDSLPARHGMLFVYPDPRTAWFWMKNTPLSLDMLFIDARGEITDLVAEAVPLDETPVGGAPRTRMVLEIAGGAAARLGIRPGSMVAHPLLDQDTALWPCARP